MVVVLLVGDHEVDGAVDGGEALWKMHLWTKT
jgi:hypothetical protein